MADDFDILEPPARITRPLYMTEAEIAKAIGISDKRFREVALVWERDGFPRKDPQIGRRYWPAVRAWLDRRHNMGRETSGGPRR